ncbi:autoinducer binding domain-containing protein [Xanthomonas nasturtii]|uniref:helix-turn-helix transcriptional regulator n=1 Tax=Xanthomonas TaxID=338 RepID=UPI002B23378F|nr:MULTISPECIES: autoinducer binding domain-containing protein [Xanthomonas]MEA9557477.1 autoinducer binding domain-containing protein [Xanthomonas nasturtii]MEA9588533.1 autoinducer binding domain-containing protein [Xanthomonas sp. WHRI 10064B]MEA9613518.1 autoinducer binding domain-containing protein [Xanthomonas sp. WHRI 10064A]
MLNDLIRSFIEEVEACNDKKDLQEKFEKYLLAYGVRFFAYNIHRISPLISHSHLASDSQRFLITNYPQDWLSYYFWEKYDTIDPVIELLSSKSGFVDWDNIKDLSGLSKRQAGVMMEARGVGLSSGITFPLLAEFGESVAISLVPQGLAEKERLISSISEIYILAQCFHHRARKILFGQSMKEISSRRKTLLSSREVDVLTWIAKGKTAAEIAQILEISKKSVDFYTETAREKLYSENRAHAVVKAIILGLIEL